jgi:hypothetical protein
MSVIKGSNEELDKYLSLKIRKTFGEGRTLKWEALNRLMDPVTEATMMMKMTKATKYTDILTWGVKVKEAHQGVKRV